MPNGLEQPCFGPIAKALLEHVRHEAACEIFTEPFMRTMPFQSPGLLDSVRRRQQQLVLMAEAARLFDLMASHESAIRIVAGITPGTRKLAAA